MSAIDFNGRLFGWGYNLYGQVGQGNTTNYSSPVQIGTSSWSYISAGEYQLSGLIGNTAWVLGYGNNYGLGAGGATSYSSPVQVAAGTIYQQTIGIAAGTYTSVALMEASVSANANPVSLYAWGINQSGQFGNGITASYNTSPILVNSMQFGKAVYATSNTIIRQ
jgi:alpha-tubulin suppressor-like RCC1 family protein